MSARIRFLLFLARKAGYFIGVFGRAQTRLLTAAQFHGWRPESEEAEARLARKQFQLFLYRRSKAELRKLKASKGVL